MNGNVRFIYNYNLKGEIYDYACGYPLSTKLEGKRKSYFEIGFVFSCVVAYLELLSISDMNPLTHVFIDI